MTTHVLGDAPLGLGFLEAAARPGARIALSGSAQSRLAAARAIVGRHAAGDAPVYGLNTGLEYPFWSSEFFDPFSIIAQE